MSDYSISRRIDYFFNKIFNPSLPIWNEAETVRVVGTKPSASNVNSTKTSNDNIDYTMPGKNPTLVRQNAYISVGSNASMEDDATVIHMVPVSGSSSSTNNNPPVVQPDFNRNQNVSNFKTNGASISANSSSSYSNSVSVNPADLPTNNNSPSLIPTISFTVDASGNKTFETAHGKTIIDRSNRLSQQQPDTLVNVNESKSQSTLQIVLIAGIIVTAIFLKN